MVARFLALLALLMPLPALAQDDGPSTLAGSWALQVGPATIFRFDIAPVEGGEGEWRGTWARPQSFATDGDNFSQMVLPARITRSMAGLEFDGEVELSFDDPRPGAIPDIFRFRLIDADAVEMEYVGTDLTPYTLHRVKPGLPLGPYEEGAVYRRTVPKAARAEESGAVPPVPPSTDVNGYRLPPTGTPTR